MSVLDKADGLAISKDGKGLIILLSDHLDFRNKEKHKFYKIK